MTKEIMLSDATKKRVEQLKTMGLLECEAFKAEVVNSTVEDPTKFFLYDLIDERIKNLSIQDALIESEDPEQAKEWALNGASGKWKKSSTQDKASIYKADFESCKVVK